MAGSAPGMPQFESDPGTLTITGVTTTPVIAPLAKEFKGSYYHMTNRATVVIRLATAEGITGEAYVGDEDKSLPELEAIIHTEIVPNILGLNAFRTEEVWARAFPATFDILRDRRLGLVAVAAIDTAVWDAVGKALGQPLWRLWGGYRNTIDMIAIGGYYGEPLGTIADEIAYYQHLGLAGIKFKVGGRSPAVDAARVLAAREAAGDDWVIAIDANQGYSVTDAVDLCRRIQGANIRWFEEPVQWMNDKRALRDVRMIGGIPVCAGQSEYSPAGCRDLMESGSIDVCNFDASWSGGPTAWRRTAAMAHAYDTAMGHHEEPQVSTHLLTSIPHGTYAECFHPDRDPFWWNMIVNRPELVGGTLTLSEAPGFGWELNQEYIDRWTVRA
jgi:D-galactarolactone cycloisomerase